MKNIFNPAHRQELLQRVDALKPDSQRLWGTLSVEGMINHIGRQLLVGLGEIEVPPKSSPMALPGVRWLMICVVPWPKGAQTAPQLLPADPESFESEKAGFHRLVESFVEQEPRGFSPHPLFGSLSTGLWGQLAYRHVDHHLRQFGV